VLDFVRTWLFPAACAACDEPGPALCHRCAPAPCDAVAFRLDGIAAFALGAYDGALRRAIVAMKAGQRDPLDAFADLLAARAPLDGALVPLPTSRARRAGRGFDQSVELARRIATCRGVPCAELLDKRGAAQEGRKRAERLAATGRFRLRAGLPLPDAVTLLDDVCTTGATARDAGRVLRAAGIHVQGLVFVARSGS
jgi:predicted amidophosphoribosyltransferase